jgi:uncharacterized repeat protein (TIGR03803 family)
MSRIPGIAGRAFFGLALVFAALFPAQSVSAKNKEVVLHSFKGGSDGAFPYGRLLMDDSGNLYGTTAYGGGSGCGGKGCGAVFKLSPDGTETVLHAFQGSPDGAYPQGDLITDAQGNLYGAASGGPTNDGVVFKIAPDGTETILHAFCSQPLCADGGGPGNLVMDSQGNLYGPAAYGGSAIGSRDCYSGCGALFKIAPDGTETVLHAFAGGNDGALPDALVMDGAGNLFGATDEGGNHRYCFWNPYGCGTIFEIPANGAKRTLYKFCSQPDCTDGFQPSQDLMLDGQGNVLGPTCCAISGTLIFKVTPNGDETVLHTFKGPPSDGLSPLGGLVLDTMGNLYGATFQGGSGSGCQGGLGCGAIFKLAPSGQISMLYSFTQGKGGTNPSGGVIADKAGNLFGVAEGGGAHNFGVVFEINK